MFDQLRVLPDDEKTTISGLISDFEEQGSPEARVAKDADVLEAVLHVREQFHERANLEHEWTLYLRRNLHTVAGAEMFEEIVRSAPNDWWISAVREQPTESSGDGSQG